MACAFPLALVTPWTPCTHRQYFCNSMYIFNNLAPAPQILSGG
jgi:hypothetical protein